MNLFIKSCLDVMPWSLAVACCFLLSSNGFAAILVSEDFDTGETVGNAPLDGAVAYTTTDRITVANTETAFGSNYANIDDNAGSADAQWNNGQSGLSVGNSLYTISFDFFEPTNATRNGNIRFMVGISSSNQDQSHVLLEFNDGLLEAGAADVYTASTSYNLDSLYSVRLVVNDESGAAANYGSFSVAENTFDVFLNNALVLDDVATSTAGTSDTWGWDTDNGGRQQLFIDNFQIETGAVAPIPEPTSFVLLALGGAALFLRRRTNRKN